MAIILINTYLFNSISRDQLQMIYLLGRGEVLLFLGNHVLFTWMRAQTSMVLWNLAIQFSLGSSWSISFFMHFRDILPGLASILFNAPAISVCMLIYIQQPKQAHDLQIILFLEGHAHKLSIAGAILFN